MLLADAQVAAFDCDGYARRRAAAPPDARRLDSTPARRAP